MRERRAQVADHRGIIGLRALNRLPRTSAKVNDHPLACDVNDSPSAPASTHRSISSIVTASVLTNTNLLVP
jgi:hypothetical protein